MTLLPEFQRLEDAYLSSVLCHPFSGSHRDMEPPDPIPNSEVKRVIADDSVGFPHAKVGHCQVEPQKPRYSFE